MKQHVILSEIKPNHILFKSCKHALLHITKYRPISSGNLL